MNSGIARKCLREAWVPTVICTLGFFLFQILLTRVMSTMDAQFTEQILRLGFVRVILQALLGAEIAELGPTALRAFAWIHPVILTLAWAHALTLCSRLPAGELDQGTADVLLTLPVSRPGLFFTDLAVWIGSLVVVLGGGAIGHVVGMRTLPEPLEVDYGATFRVVVNLFVLVVCVGTFTRVTATFASRRGRALGVSISLVLLSFFWNFVCQFWPTVSDYAWLSVLEYYQPMRIFSDGAWPLRDLGILGALAMVFAGLALGRFVRRDH